MPRASGGGSHSSGSHSSSSSYSRSSSSSSSSSYSSSSGYYQPERKVSRHYFNGAERYRYYNWRHEPVYVYMNAAPEKPSLFKLILSIIVSGAMIFSGRWLVGITKEYKNEPLPLMGNEKAYIEDNAGILDAKVFEEGFDTFMENTGIIPSVISVNNEDWQPYYNNLESYALELYLKHFDDEQHFLIVYSEPKEVDPKFNDWYWEAIQGDDTINIITEDTFASFQNDMMTYLVREEYTTSEAIAKCFENGAIVMKQDGKINDDGRFIMIYGVGFLLAGGGLLCFFLKKYYDSKCLYEAEIV